MQIEALNSACVSKQKVSNATVKETVADATDSVKESSGSGYSSTGYDWLDEAYKLVFGEGKSSGGALDDIDWNKWSRSSSSNLSKTKLPYGTKLDFSKWANITLDNGTSMSDLPADAFSGSYEDFEVAIYSIF